MVISLLSIAVLLVSVLVYGVYNEYFIVELQFNLPYLLRLLIAKGSSLLCLIFPGYPSLVFSASSIITISS